MEIKLNGKTVDYQIKNGYAILSKKWKKGDKVDLTLPVNVQSVIANSNLPDDIGKITLRCVLIMYCTEWKDNDGKEDNIIIPQKYYLITKFKPDLLNGVLILKGNTKTVDLNKVNQTINTEDKTVTTIAYYSRVNCDKVEMTVWFQEQVKDIERIAK